MSTRPQRLFDLLPATVRAADASGQLQALCATLGLQLELIEADVDGLYDNWFIETCQLWAVPYLADLIGMEALASAPEILPVHRAWIGRTVEFRRRKGVAAVLQPLAWCTAGWGGRVSEAHVGLVPVVTLSLWTAQAWPTSGVLSARPGGGALRTFDPLGLDVPLFNQPLAQPPPDRTATDAELPLQIRMARLAADLTAYRSRYGHLPEDQRPDHSTFYGADRAIQLLLDDVAVPPWSVRAKDLSSGATPPSVDVALDGAPLSLPVTLAAPVQPFSVRMGSGPTVSVAPAPGTYATLASLASAVESAIRSSSTDPAYAQADVISGSGRLAVLAGTRGLPAQLFATGGGNTTLQALGLDPSHAVSTQCSRSDVLSPFPTLGSSGVLQATLNGVGPSVVQLAGPLATLNDLVTSMQAGLAKANGSAAFTDAMVAAASQTLIVVPGRAGPGGDPTWMSMPAQPDLAETLGLATQVYIDPELGRWSASVSPTAVATSVYNTGLAGPVGSGTYSRPLGTTPSDVDLTIRIHRAGSVPTLGAALAAWQAAGQPKALFLIEDSGTYTCPASLGLVDGSELVIEAAPQQRPTLLANTGLDVGPKNGAASLQLSGLTVLGGLQVGPLVTLHLRIGACTLIPAPPAKGVASAGRALVLDSSGAAPTLVLTVESSVIGPIEGQNAVGSATLSDSVVGHLSVQWPGHAPLAPTFALNLPDVDLDVGASTFFGTMSATRLTASNALFTDSATVTNTSVGCVRNSFVAAGSTVPYQVACVDGGSGVAPSFQSTHWPDPGFARMTRGTSTSLTEGGTGGAQMGAFHALNTPWRLRLLKAAAGSHLPFGVELTLSWES